MIGTQQTITALIATLAALNDGAEPAPAAIFETVIQHHEDNIDTALETLRVPHSRLAIVIPGPTTIRHQLLDGDDNTPLRAELTTEANLLFTERDLAHGTGGAPAILPLKDILLARLMWDNLGIAGLLTLPDIAEPIQIAYEDGHRLDAWRMRIEIRTTILPS